MAIDSRNKRASAVNYALPFNRVYPNPDGALTEVGDRIQMAGLYRGIVPRFSRVFRNPGVRLLSPERNVRDTRAERSVRWMDDEV